MLNLKKLLTKVLTKTYDVFNMPTPHWTKSVTLTAGSSTAVSLSFSDADIDLTDYRLLALNSIDTTGTNSEYIYLRGFNISNGNRTFTIKFKSTATSSTITFNVSVYGLALKTA